jgi:mRNA-degrading endonuclease toxin of MazEF toxin-antitoxin module
MRLAIAIYQLNKLSGNYCDQVRTVDKSRLVNYIEEFSNKDIEQLEKSLKTILVL